MLTSRARAGVGVGRMSGQLVHQQAHTIRSSSRTQKQPWIKLRSRVQALTPLITFKNRPRRSLCQPKPNQSRRDFRTHVVTFAHTYIPTLPTSSTCVCTLVSPKNIRSNDFAASPNPARTRCSGHNHNTLWYNRSPLRRRDAFWQQSPSKP